MLQQLVAQHASGSELPLPDYVRTGWLTAARARFEASGMISGDEASGEGGLQAGAELYGEINFDSLAVTLEAIRARHGGLAGAPGSETFIDVGSGSGLPVVGAAALHAWRAAIGIEIIPALHDVALENAQRWRDLKAASPSAADASETAGDDVRFVCCDALTPEDEVASGLYAAADVVLCLCTAFSEPMMGALAAQLEQAKPGAFLITATVGLPSASWTVLETLYLPMSWGSTKLYIHKKQDDFPRWADAHKPQLSHMRLPEVYWRQLHVAVRERRFDAGSWVQFAMDEAGDLFVLASREIAPASGEGLMLLDHAWSFATLGDAEESLRVVEGLLLRVHELLFPAMPLAEIVEGGAEGVDAAVKRVMEALERKVGSYTVTAAGADGGRTTTFFVLDEVGSRLGLGAAATLGEQPQPEPEAEGDASAPAVENYKCLPFFSLDERVAYSVGWPCASLATGEELVTSSDSPKAAWAKLSDPATGSAGGAAEAAGWSAEFVDFQAKREFEMLQAEVGAAEGGPDVDAELGAMRAERAAQAESHAGK